MPGPGLFAPKITREQAENLLKFSLLFGAFLLANNLIPGVNAQSNSTNGSNPAPSPMPSPVKETDISLTLLMGAVATALPIALCYLCACMCVAACAAYTLCGSAISTATNLCNLKREYNQII